MEIIEFEHPIARDFVTRLRSKYFQPSRFRAYSSRIGYLLAVEATRNLTTSPARVETPLEETLGEVLSDSPVIIPVLRAGLGLLDPFMSILPDSPVAFIGLRDNGDSRVAELLCQEEPNLAGSTVVLLDPMVASGETAEKVLDYLYGRGVEHVILVSVLAAPEGIARLKKYEELTLITATVDRELDQDWLIRPGLGDFADRLFRGGS
jgi:uracil phosphoribosyltransferase